MVVFTIMKKVLASLVVAALMVCHVPQLAAEETEAEPRYREKKNYILGIGGMAFSNLALFSINKYIGKTEFSRVCSESMRNHLTCKWQWDSSTFRVNQLGHPYQGYTYYAAGRANNLNALESTLLTAMGSYTWEVFAERVTPAANDFISTTVGGVALGEMLHRIYLDTYTDNRIIASLISPMDAANDLVNGRKQRPTHSKIRSLTFSALSGYRVLDDRRNNEHNSDKSYHTVATGFTFDLRYGDPYARRTKSIYDHFDFAAGFEGGYLWYDSYIVSDGVLFSVTPKQGGPSWTSYGMNLHFDYYSNPLMDFSADSVTFSIRKERPDEDAVSYRLKADVGAILFGASSFMRNELQPELKKQSQRMYGVGGMAKLSTEFVFPVGATVSAQTAHYYMVILPHTVPDSEGIVLYNTSSLSIKQRVNNTVSVGAITSFSWKKTRHEKLPDHDKMLYKISTFLERSL